MDNAIKENPVQMPTQPGQKKGLITAIAALLSMTLTLALLVNVFLGTGSTSSNQQSNSANVGIMDRYDMYVTNQVSNALDGVLSIKKVYWLSDDDLIAPEPNQDCYGETDDPSSLEGLLEEAKELLGFEETIFRTDIKLYEGSKVIYYLDETIFAITWQELKDNVVYTMSEVKVAHPSQFRRYLAGGEYGSDKQFITTQMAADVNAVVASSGDFYKFRQFGTIVYDGVVQRINSWQVDTCFIDDMGNLIFKKAGELTDIVEAQKFVDENNIRFSLAFGPVLIENGERAKLGGYLLGEVNDKFPRAALCQKGELHYLVVVCNGEGYHWNTPTIYDFADRVAEFGCDMAYTLDGGQTGVIAMNDKLINPVHYGYQRRISDIFYFATALPDGE